MTTPSKPPVPNHSRFEELLKTARPERDLNVALVRVNLGECYYQQQKYAQAEAVLRQGYEELKRFGANLPLPTKDSLIQALDRLDSICQQQGRPDEAAQWFQELKARKAAGTKP